MYDAPMTLAFGQAIVYPGVSNGNLATESMPRSEALKTRFERRHITTRHFREAEFGTKTEVGSQTAEK